MGTTAGTTTVADAGLYSSIAGGVMQSVGSYYSAAGAKRGMNAQAAVMENNASLAEYQAKDAYDRGQRAEQNARLKNAQFKGSQRARLAANGVALDEGTALNLLTSTDVIGDQEAAVIRDNAAREATGYQNQAINDRNNARLTRAGASGYNPALSFASTAFSAAGSVADKWYRYSELKNGRSNG